MQYQLFGLSPYVYVRNNPLNRFDPDGYVDWPQVGLGALGVLGGIGQTISGGAIVAGTGVTGVGAVGGVIVMTHGLSITGFGLATMIAGFQDNGTEVPGGPFEAIGQEISKATGSEVYTTVGVLADGLVGSGNPLRSLKDAAKALPSSAREARANIGYQKTVAKELVITESSVSSDWQVITSTKELIMQVLNGDEY